jgi:hypothetical protein
MGYVEDFSKVRTMLTRVSRLLGLLDIRDDGM